MVTKIVYEQLPHGVRTRIEGTIGAIVSTVEIGDGRNSAVAAMVETAHRSCFVKALRTDHRWVWTQTREAEVAEHLAGLGPPLVMRLVQDGWDVLIFERLTGHQASYTPRSADLPKVAALLTRIGQLPLPHVTLSRAEQRLQPYAPAVDLPYFRGATLLHTDLNNTNVLVDGQYARLVDWGWATQGAAWLDAGYWIIWLIAAGHTPTSAERWASCIPAWHAAPPAGIDAFAAANACIWTEIGDPDPDAWTRHLMQASAAWHAYRSAIRRC
jgi:hypothetical protein